MSATVNYTDPKTTGTSEPAAKVADAPQSAKNRYVVTYRTPPTPLICAVTVHADACEWDNVDRRVSFYDYGDTDPIATFPIDAVAAIQRVR